LKKQSGFTHLEIIVAVIVIGVLAAVAVKPIRGFLERLRMQNAAEGMKHFILNARVRAVSNPNRHCGIVIRLHSNPSIDDTLFAFFDKNPPDYHFVSGEDELYAAPLVIPKRGKLVSTVPSGFPTEFVFRGDGSANQSAKIVLNMGAFRDTVDLLASTGRVKVIAK
jgi:prepilin-type N-terminal cleavage/methylation domain-containing protein